MGYKFFCDFDGTITKEDVIDRILEEFAAPQWRDIEQSWAKGEIGSRECLAMQTRLIKAHECDLLGFVEEIEIDETFIDFVRYCQDESSDLIIISDGIDLFINSILTRYGLSDMRVYANSLGHNSNGYEMAFSYFREDCRSRSGICKCRIMEELSSPEGINILIGDGRSDFCVAAKADLIFAKSSLSEFCTREKIPYIEHKEFEDIREWLINQKRRDGSVSQRFLPIQV
jgi:2-hydroxy-3-keto-5-methylthiopentenyl-1-phosphate phosphatase